MSFPPPRNATTSELTELRNKLKNEVSGLVGFLMTKRAACDAINNDKKLTEAIRKKRLLPIEVAMDYIDGEIQGCQKQIDEINDTLEFRKKFGGPSLEGKEKDGKEG